MILYPIQKLLQKCHDLAVTTSPVSAATVEGETGELESSSENGNKKQEGNASSASVPTNNTAAASKKKLVIVHLILSDAVPIYNGIDPSTPSYFQVLSFKQL
jgi:hypothetical protein